MTNLQSLLVGVQNGDSVSQRDLYDTFKGKVMGICRRFTKDKAEAEDVFQETFIRVFRHIDQVEDAEHLEAWIRKISVNTAVNYYQKNKKHEHAAERNGIQFKDGEYELILSNFTDQMVVAMINDLPDGYRVVFNLHAIEGYSHAEIGEMLGISDSTSRSQLNRARQMLKTKLQSLGIIKYEQSA